MQYSPPHSFNACLVGAQKMRVLFCVRAGRLRLSGRGRQEATYYDI